MMATAYLRAAVCAVAILATSRLSLAEPSVFYLQPSPRWAVQGDYVRQGLLLREIGRQSVLAVAREDLGMSTRDAWLDDRFVPETMVSFDLVASPGPKNRLELLEGEPPYEMGLWRDRFSLPNKPINYVAYLTEMEARAREKIAPVLRNKLGVAARTVEEFGPLPSRAVPKDIEPLLAEMSLDRQFLAIRRLHAEIHRGGESNELTGALVRAYANLGVLTEPYWHAMHQVFKARALVYAQRMVARDPTSFAALQYRAYALALVGLQGAAIKDLEGPAAPAGLAAAANQPLQEPPAWAMIIDQYCHYQLGALDAVPKDDPYYELAHLLRYLATVDTGIRQRMVSAIGETIKHMPHCERLLDGTETEFGGAFQEGPSYSNLSEGYGVDEINTARELNYKLRGETWYKHLASLPGVPAAVVELEKERVAKRIAPKTREEYKLRQRLIESLLAVPDVDDGSELPWSLLGQMVQEVSFFQVLDTTYGGVENLDRVESMEPLMAHHRYKTFIGATGDRPSDTSKLDELAKQLQYEALETKTWMLDSAFYVSHPSINKYAFDMRTSHDDLVSREINVGIHDTDSGHQDWERMLAVNPYCPRPAYLGLKYRPAQFAKRMPQWEVLAADHPTIRSLLRFRQAETAPPEEQLKLLKESYESSRTHHTAMALAQYYLSKGDVAAWKATADEFLTDAKPEQAADVRRYVADGFVKLRRFDDGLPYALAMVKTGVPYGHLLAASLYEGKQDWRKAEEHIREWSESDENRRLQWYFFVMRTGEGNYDEAADLAKKLITKGQKSPEHMQGRIIEEEPSGVYYLLEDNPKQALPAFRNHFLRVDDPSLGLQAVLIADRLNLSTDRAELFKLIKTNGKRFKVFANPPWVRTQLIAFAALLEEDLAAGGKVAFDQAKLDKLRQDAHPLDRLHMDYFLGVYCAQHGKEAEAIEHWKRCMSSPRMVENMRTLAGAELVKRSIKPEVYRDALQDKTPKQGK